MGFGWDLGMWSICGLNRMSKILPEMCGTTEILLERWSKKYKLVGYIVLQVTVNNVRDTWCERYLKATKDFNEALQEYNRHTKSKGFWIVTTTYLCPVFQSYKDPEEIYYAINDSLCPLPDQYSFSHPNLKKYFLG